MISVQPAQAQKFLTVQISDTNPHVSPSFNFLQYNYAGLQLSTLAGSTLAGAWKIEVSNDSGGTWADITSGFTPTFAAVVSGASSQFGQCLPLVAQMLRVTFTATSGSGTATAAICLKGSSL